LVLTGKKLLYLRAPSPGVEVDIGGAIHVEKKTYSSALSSEDTVFFVEFELSCKNAKLRDATLFAKVLLGTQEITSQPVILGPNGRYQVSWSLPTKKAVGGDYQVAVYREVDRRRFEASAEPFFSVGLSYTPPLGSPLPVKTEFLALVILGAAFLFASFKKMDIEGPKRK